jgi:hypothetical protein
MATNHNTHDPFRNPQVDYDRSDLSPKGILWFLIGLFIVGFFIELVVWGMFRFMARSEILFAQGQVSPMKEEQPAPYQNPPSVFQNTPETNLGKFPEPRLQINDAGDMTMYLDSENNLLDAQPFTDPQGNVHIPISMAMQLIEQRGLPTRPNAPPPDLEEQTGAGNPKILNEQPGELPPGGGNGAGVKKAGGE